MPPATADLPVCRLDLAWHVGSMNPADKRTWSYEGQGLSVSLHPEEWTTIARLGGHPTWRLTRPGGTFLDYHALTGDQRAQITAWGLGRGYVTEQPAYFVPFTDEDGEDIGSMAFLDREEAEEEADFRYATVTEARALVATDTFPDPTVRVGEINPDQILTVIWLAETHPEFDGVWWEDTYAPDMLSCPRGVIHPHRLAAWTITRQGDA